MKRKKRWRIKRKKKEKIMQEYETKSKSNHSNYIRLNNKSLQKDHILMLEHLKKYKGL